MPEIVDERDFAIQVEGRTVPGVAWVPANTPAPCPVVLTIHDLYFINYPGRHRPVYEAIVTRAARSSE
jgi:hypothetical protein